MRQLSESVRAIEAVPCEERIDAVSRWFGEDRVRSVLGHGRKEVMPSEAMLYPCDKRSLHASTDVDAGTILSSANVRVLRSERNLSTGLHPRYFEQVLGARTSRPIRRGEGIRWEHLIQR
jgi:N-acetylneuraminate synthase